MSTIKLSTAYQLVLTSLLLGAILGIVAQQLPLTFSAVVPSVRAMVVEERGEATAAQSTPQSLMNADRTMTTIVGQDAQRGLWLVCCEQNQLFWVSNQIVSTLESRAAIAEDQAGWPNTTIVDAGMLSATQYQQGVQAGTNTLPTPSYPYTLVQQQQYSEQITPRIYLYVSERVGAVQTQGVANLGLRVKKDGVALSTSARTHGGRPDFTWPIVHERQQLANLKVEFPHIEAAGLWEIQLVDANGDAVGAPVQLLFSANEPNREIYLHYQKQ